MKPSWNIKTSAIARALALTGEVVAETLWPTRCAVCDLPGDLICSRCRKALLFIDANDACPRCGAPFGRNQCTECNETMLAAAGRETLPFDGMQSALLADDAARRIITAYKDSNERRLAKEIALMLARYVPPEWHHAHLTYIPATAEAVRRRGFDHAALLAKTLADLTDMDGSSLLQRPKSADQRKLGRRARQRNMEGRFSVLSDAPIPSEVLLIDDVCTTGATVCAATDCLRASGVKRVFILTFAKVLAS